MIRRLAFAALSLVPLLTFLPLAQASSGGAEGRAGAAADPVREIFDGAAQADPGKAPAGKVDPSAGPFLPDGSSPDVESFMPLRDAVVLALRNNIDIELARVEPAIADEGIKQAKGAFDPIASLGWVFGHEENPVASSFERNTRQTVADDWTYDAGINGILPFGLRYQSGYNMRRAESNSQTAVLRREFRGGWVNQITMPLMRDFGMNEAKVRVVRSQLGRKISEDVFTGRVTDLLASVENLYWDLAATRAQVNVAHKSLKTAQDLLEQTRVQQEVGVVSRVAVTQAEAGVAERELNSIQAENAAAAARDKLVNALLAPSAQVYADRDMIPEVPTFDQRYHVDLNEAIAKAMKNRPDLSEARKRVESAEVEKDFAGNQVRPKLDLVASYTLNGLSGRSKLFSETFQGQGCPADPDPVTCAGAASPADGSSWDSFRDFFTSSGNHGFTAGAQVEVPLGNRTARANLTQRNIEIRRARAQLRRVEQVAILDVRDAVRNIDNAAKAVGAAERRRTAASETLRAEQEKLRLGDSTPFQVLQFEEDLADSERQLIDALRSHRNAITRVEQMQGTLLSARGVDIDDELNRTPTR